MNHFLDHFWGHFWTIFWTIFWNIFWNIFWYRTCVAFGVDYNAVFCPKKCNLCDHFWRRFWSHFWYIILKPLFGIVFGTIFCRLILNYRFSRSGRDTFISDFRLQIFILVQCAGCKIISGTNLFVSSKSID